MAANDTCIISDSDGTDSSPLPAQLALVPLVLVVVIGAVKTNTKWRHLLSGPSFRFLPAFSTWLDLTWAEFLSCTLWFVLSGLPVILSGLKSGIFNTAIVAGEVAEIALALTIVPATRTSLWVRVLGMSYDRALRFHRWAAWWAIAAMWTHFLLYIGKAGPCVLDNAVGEAPPLYGFASVLLFTFLSLASLNFLRRHLFEVFRSLHWLFLPAFFLALLHTGGIAKYAGFPGALWLFDRVRRWMRSRHVWKVLRMTAAAGVTHIEVAIPSNAGFSYEAGQFCFIKIPTLSRFEWHPFSVTSFPGASAAGETVPSLSFAVKSMGAGTWSGRLLSLATHGSVGGVAVQVDGAFGSLSRHVYSARHVLLIGGGIGATPLISVLGQLALGSSGVCKKVTLVWVVRDLSELEWSRAALVAATRSPTCAVDVRLHVTGSTRLGHWQKECKDSEELEVPVFEGIPVTHGRPKLETLFQELCVPPRRAVGTFEVENPVLVHVHHSVTKPEQLKDTRVSPSNAAVTATPPPVPTTASDSELEVVVLASGPAPLVASAQTLSTQHGITFHHETFLF